MKKKLNIIWHASNVEVTAEFDWISYLLSNFNLHHHFDKKYEICLDRSIVVIGRVVSANVSLVREYFKRCKDSNLRIGIIHVGDEFLTDNIDFYKYADFIFRSYYRPYVINPPSCQFIPVGYYNGFCGKLTKRPIGRRKYRISFLGQLKGSRAEMLYYAEKIPGNKYFSTAKNWREVESISKHSDIINDTLFVLCPKGNRLPDTFRLYEAMEAGAIPIVETDAGGEIWRETFNLHYFSEIGCWKLKYWRKNYRRYLAKSYWHKAYGREFPCPLIYHWGYLEQLLKKIDIEKTSKEINEWWDKYKRSLIATMTETIHKAFE